MDKYVLNVVRADARIEDLRACKRAPVYTEAAFVSAAELPTDLTCAVRDISELGARLEIDRDFRRKSAHVALPEQVNIYFGPRQAEALCRVMWQDGAHFGVAFLEPLRKPDTEPKAPACRPLAAPSQPRVASCRDFTGSED